MEGIEEHMEECVLATTSLQLTSHTHTLTHTHTTLSS